MKTELIQALENACIKAKEMGWKLTDGLAGRTIARDEKCCCLFGAVYLTQEGRVLSEEIYDTSTAETAASLLGICGSDMWDIIQGWDGVEHYSCVNLDSEGTKLGQRLRQTYGQ